MWQKFFFLICWETNWWFYWTQLVGKEGLKQAVPAARVQWAPSPPLSPRCHSTHWWLRTRPSSLTSFHQLVRSTRARPRVRHRAGLSHFITCSVGTVNMNAFSFTFRSGLHSRLVLMCSPISERRTNPFGESGNSQSVDGEGKVPLIMELRLYFIETQYFLKKLFTY